VVVIDGEGFIPHKGTTKDKPDGTMKKIEQSHVRDISTSKEMVGGMWNAHILIHGGITFIKTSPPLLGIGEDPTINAITCPTHFTHRCKHESL